MKFFIPFAVLVAVGRQFGWQSTTTVVQPDVTFVIDVISQPYSRPDLHAVSLFRPSPNASVLPFVFFAI